MSLALMRYRMLGRADISSVIPELLQHQNSFGRDRYEKLGTVDFAAGIFIGGMEGVEREFNIFRHFHPRTPAWPIASTGSACVRLLDGEDLTGEPADMLRQETVYSLLSSAYWVILPGRHGPPDGGYFASKTISIRLGC